MVQLDRSSKRLWLNDNQISDVGPLASLTNLTKLYLGYNQLNQERIDVQVPNFEGRGVLGYYGPGIELSGFTGRKGRVGRIFHTSGWKERLRKYLD